MKKKFQFDYTEYKDISETYKDIQILMSKAKKAREKAYAPYSQFMVGAALKDSDGNIYLGNNQENAAYPSGLCAERVAIYHASATNPDAVFTDLAICVKSPLKKLDFPTAPCGACRQSLAEYETKQMKNIRIHFMGETGSVIQVASIKNLLPFLFDSNSLL